MGVRRSKGAVSSRCVELLYFGLVSVVFFLSLVSDTVWLDTIETHIDNSTLFARGSAALPILTLC